MKVFACHTRLQGISRSQERKKFGILAYSTKAARGPRSARDPRSTASGVWHAWRLGLDALLTISYTHNSQSIHNQSFNTHKCL